MSRIEYKTADQIRLMRKAGLVVADIHAALRAAAVPGITTAELDDVARRVLQDAGARSNFLGYHGYPAHVCISVNEEVVHGIPGGRALAAGDVVSFDCGAVVDGWHGDAAFTMILDGHAEASGDNSDGADRDGGTDQDGGPAQGGTAHAEGSCRARSADVELSEVTRDAMWSAIAALADGRRLNVVGEAVETVVEQHAAAGHDPLTIIEDYVGHGIGSAMHQEPDVPNYRTARSGARLRPGMCLAVEPMLTRGSGQTRVLDDDWTVVTADGARAAHWEHTVAIHEGGIWVLTAPDGGAAELAERGVQVAPLTR